MKNVFVFAGLLLVWVLISCNEIEPLPLPTLAPTAQVPPTLPTNQVAEPTETPASDPVSSESEDVPIFIGEGSIAYYNIAGDGLFIVNFDQSEPIQFYDLHSISQFFDISPDGEWLALRNGGKLFSAKMDGSNINELIELADVLWVSWSPGGDRFAFVQNGDIFTINADGKNTRQLTNGLGLMDSSTFLSWSPDGSYLLFICAPTMSDICLVDSHGEESLINLTKNTEPGWYREPSWSPDGNLISFVSRDQEANMHIFVMNVDGSNIVQLTDVGENSLHVWSPDGTRIAYTSVIDNKWQAIAMNQDGSEKLIMPANLPIETNSIYPSWSPSGDRIGLYYTQASNPDEFAILVWDINNSERITLTERAKWAEWSPDGAQIAFLSSDTQINIVNTDGTGSTNVIECVEGCEYFTWVP